MTMNPKMNHANKVNLMDANKMNSSVDKAPATQTGGAMHGGNGTGSNEVGTKTPQYNGTTPIFIDIENLDLTVICGNQENYHENINGSFGCMQDGQQMDCDGECYDDCDCCDDDEDWDDDEFDEAAMPEDAETPCNTCDFSEECLKNSIESEGNIFLDQIIRKMAFIADVPISTAMMVLNAYLILCSVFDEEPPVRFKKRKYDVHRIPIGLDDLTNRIHKAATALAYGLAETEGVKGNEGVPKGTKAPGAKPATPNTQKSEDKKPTVAPTSDAKDTPEQDGINDGLSLLSDSFKEAMKDAPEMVKKFVSLLGDKGDAVRIYRVEVMKKEEPDDAVDADKNTTEASKVRKEKVNSRE